MLLEARVGSTMPVFQSFPKSWRCKFLSGQELPDAMLYYSAAAAIKNPNMAAILAERSRRFSAAVFGVIIRRSPMVLALAHCWALQRLVSGGWPGASAAPRHSQKTHRYSPLGMCHLISG